MKQRKVRLKNPLLFLLEGTIDMMALFIKVKLKHRCKISTEDVPQMQK